MYNKAKIPIIKMKKKLDDGSFDSYHYYAIFYCVSPIFLLLLFFVELVSLKFVIQLSTNIIQISIIIIFSLLFFISNIYILRILLKKLPLYFKQKSFLLFLLIFPNLLSIILTILFWLRAAVGGIHNLLLLFLLKVTQNSTGNLYNPFEDIAIMIESLSNVGKTTLLLSIFISFSLMLNSTLPKHLQKKDVEKKAKRQRFFFKTVIMLLAVSLTYIFSIIDKNNFAAISIFTTLFTFACTPQTLLRIFSKYKNIGERRISDSVYKMFDVLKLFYYEMILSWSISIYIFNPKETAGRIYIFMAILFFLLFTTIVTQYYLLEKKKVAFSKWFISDSKMANRKYKKSERNPRYKKRRFS